MKYFRSCRRILTPAVAATFAVVLSGCVWSSTGAPRIVADTSATLTGAVKSSQDDYPVTYWFKYGTTPDYGSTTTTHTTGVRKGTNGVSELVDGLTAGTTYHYQLCSDAPDHLPPACSADQVVTTTTGHDSVHGQGSYSYTEPPCPAVATGIDCYDAFSILAAVDPNSSAIEGDLTFEGLLPGTPMSGQIRYTGVGIIQCILVSGNIAVVGYVEYTHSDFGDGGGEGHLVIEDNGATGDRYLQVPSVTSACPTPSASLFDSGTPHSGDFVVHDG